MTIRPLYNRARLSGMTSARALAAARAYIAGPLAEYNAKMAAFKAEPDKRHYAPGGRANRPKMPKFCADAYAPASGPHYTGDGRMVCDGRTLSGLRDCGAVDELFPRLFDHKGWYADYFQDETWRGRVWQLPARNGECLYLAGYARPNADDAVVGLHVFRENNPGGRWGAYTNARDAAIRADEMAERDAEESREYSERWSEARHADDERESARHDLRAARLDARLTIAAWRNQKETCPLVDSICAMLRGRLDDARREMREALEKIQLSSGRIAELGMREEFPA